jgi:hypothetical protein
VLKTSGWTYPIGTSFMILTTTFQLARSPPPSAQPNASAPQEMSDLSSYLRLTPSIFSSHSHRQSHGPYRAGGRGRHPFSNQGGFREGGREGGRGGGRRIGMYSISLVMYLTNSRQGSVIFNLPTLPPSLPPFLPPLLASRRWNAAASLSRSMAAPSSSTKPASRNGATKQATA